MKKILDPKILIPVLVVVGVLSFVAYQVNHSHSHQAEEHGHSHDDGSHTH